MSALIKKIVQPCPFEVGQVVEFCINVVPSDIWTNTTWVVFGVGRVTVGLNASDADFDTLRKVGGKKGHKQTLANLIEHEHDRNADGLEEFANVESYGTVAGSYSPGANYLKLYTKTGKTGSADPEAIPTVQPYIVTQKWERTA